MEIIIGQKYFIESEEQEVTVLEAQPCKASVHSEQEDAMEYRVRTAWHRDQPSVEKWVGQDEFIQANGTDDDPFIF